MHSFIGIHFTEIHYDTNATLKSYNSTTCFKYVNATQSFLCFSDLATYISEAAGRRIEYVHQTYEQFADDMRKGGAKGYQVLHVQT